MIEKFKVTKMTLIFIPYFVDILTLPNHMK